MNPEDLYEAFDGGFACTLCGFRAWSVEDAYTEGHQNVRRRIRMHVLAGHLRPIRRQGPGGKFERG